MAEKAQGVAYVSRQTVFHDTENFHRRTGVLMLFFPTSLLAHYVLVNTLVLRSYLEDGIHFVPIEFLACFTKGSSRRLQNNCPYSIVRFFVHLEENTFFQENYKI